jgi:hypothetical protein
MDTMPVRERTSSAVGMVGWCVVVKSRHGGRVPDLPIVYWDADQRSLMTAPESAEKDNRQCEQTKIGPDRRPDHGSDNQPEVGDHDDRGRLSHQADRQSDDQSRYGP